jgi:hypothetical protein
MRRLFLVAVLVCSGLIASATTVPSALLRNDAPALETRVSILPLTTDEYLLLRRSPEGLYRCSVRVHDEPGSNRIWGTKDLILGPGENGESESSLGSLQLVFRASIAKSLDRADTVVTLTRDDKVIARQHQTISLVKTTRSVEPLR